MADISVAQLRGDGLNRRKTCFVASPIGDEGSSVRKRSDIVLQYVIVAALEPMDYTINRADQLAVSGAITTQIISHLVTADVAVFDLTGNNANVFYELAIRHAANKPYVQLNDGSTIPFDVAGYRTIAVDCGDIARIEKAKMDLAATVLNFEQGADVETPLTPVPEVDVLLAAGNPIRDELATISNNVRQVLTDLHGVDMGAINIKDVGILQRVIELLSDKAGGVPIGVRTALENALYTTALREWSRSLATQG